jgi:proline iminopeptidase
MSDPGPRYPRIEPYAIHHLPVSDLHTLYIEEVGNPKGLPVIFLHGGPGIGVLPAYRKFFDPQLFRVILFSQRGANPSTPAGEVHENDTWNLVEDIETIRKHFGIKRWIVFGGSWGSTLALAYAVEHPQATAALVLRGIFLGLNWEMDWLYKEGVSHVFPEAWRDFIDLIPEFEREDIVSAYYKRIFDPSPAIHLPAAWNWVTWEDKIGTLLPAKPTPFTDETALSMARIECHYMLNRLFFDTDDYLLRQVHKLSAIPCHIIQGRYDMICPAESAFTLAKELPQAVMHLVLDAGHASGEPGITSELIAAMLDLANKLDPRVF